MKRFALIVALVLCVPLFAAMTTYQPPHLQDHLSGATVVIGDAEHHAHDGDAFKASWESPVATLPTNAGEETAIGFITPALPTLIHLTVDAWANDESIFEIREDPAITLDQGPVLVPLNRFRSSANISGMNTNESPVPTPGVTTYTVAQAAAANLAGGTILHHETLAIGGTGPFASTLNSVARGEREFILLPSTEYVIILTTGAANLNDTTHNITLNWYEHSRLVF